MAPPGCLPVGISLTIYSEEGAKNRFRSLCQTALLKPKRLLFGLTHAFAGANRVLVLGRADPLKQNRPLFWAAQTRWSKTDPCFKPRRPAEAKQTPVWAAQTRWSKTDPLFGPRRPAEAKQTPVWAAHIGWSKQTPCFKPRTSAGAKQTPCLGRADPLEQNRPPVWAAHIGWSKTDPCLGLNQMA